MYFYPTMTDELKETSGYTASEYSYSYLSDGYDKKLQAKGKAAIKLSEETDSWRVENDGVRVRRTVKFEYPETLYGKDGIACKKAELGICIRWVNPFLTQMGTILPINEFIDESTKVYEFDYLFKPGTIQGNLTLSLQIYLKKAADEVNEDELHLLNEEGVTVGTLDEVKLDFGNSYMDFPIREVSQKNQPLWWLEMSDWVDPTKDLFSEENLCVYLNTSYESCPKLGDSIKHVDVLIDIIATAYMMLFMRVDEMGYLEQTRNDVNLEPESISKILFYFKDGCGEEDLDFTSAERLHKTIWVNVADMLLRGEES